MKTLRFFLAGAFAVLASPAIAQTTVTLTAPDAAAGEKLAGQAAKSGNIRIARSGSTAGALTVYLKSVSGTALHGTDYQFGIPLTTWVAIPAGSASVDISVNVLDDWLTEGSETVRIDLDDETPSGTPLPCTIGGSGRATVTLADNEDPLAAPRAILTVAVVDAVATETPGGTDPAVFRITRTNNLAPEVKVLFTTGGTATSGVSFRVTHNFPATATVGFLYAMGGSAKEGVDYTLSSPGVVGSNFLGRWFSFPAGTTEAEIVVTPVDDLLIEATETVTMSLYEPPFIGFNEGGPQGFDPGSFGFYWGTHYSASVNVLSDDITPPPFPVITITATDGIATETPNGSDPAVFTVSRHCGPTNVPLTVNYALISIPPPYPYVFPIPSMAQNGIDFPLLSGAVIIPVGATRADISVLPSYDGFAEANESVRLILRPSAAAWPDPSGYVLDDGLVATAVIHDATLPPGTPIVSIRASDSQAFEENLVGRTASFFVQRSGNLTQEITVTYTISGTATNGVDYTPLIGSIIIPAGLAGASIVVDPVADGVTEPSESVALTLQPPPLVGGSLPYALGSSGLTQRSAGVSIRDTWISPGYGHLSPRQRIVMRRLHNGQMIVPPPIAAFAPAIATTAVSAAPEPTSWAVEASTDLAKWEEIGTVESIDEVDEFVDVNAANFQSRYYRFRPITRVP